MKFCLAICVALIARIAIALPLEHEEAPVEHEETVEEGCKSVEYDIADVDFNHFVTNQMRAEVCRSNVHFNMSGRVQIKHLGEEYNYMSHENPCIVVCQLDWSRQSGAPYTRNEYAALEKLTLHMAENSVCGPDDHRCDAHGCCAKHVEQPEEHHEEHPVEEHPAEEHPAEEHPAEEHPAEEHPVEEHHEEEHPVEEHHEEEHPVEEHHEEEHHEEEHPVEEHPVEEHHVEEEHPVEEHPVEEHHVEEEVPEKQYACTEAGVFADPEDETSFFRCYLKSAHLKCADGLFYHQDSHSCEAKKLTEAEHQALITCHSIGFFRAPYDCTKFYRCHGDVSHMQIGFFDCPASLVFDQVSNTCVQPEDTAACVNQELFHGGELHYRS